MTAMKAMAGVKNQVSILVFIAFFLNSLLARCTGSGSPDGRFPPSPSPPSLTPLLSNQDANLQVAEASNELSVRNATAATITDGTTQLQNNHSSIPLWKQKLPFPLNNKTKTLQRILIPGDGNPRGIDVSDTGSDVEIFLLGTAHISKDSCQDVRQLLDSVKPDVIFLELCHQRTMLMVQSSDNDQQDVADEEDSSKNLNATRGFWNRRLGFFRRGQISRRKNKRSDTRSSLSIAASLFSDVQQEYADALGVELGGEFCTAYEYWKRVVPRETSNFRSVKKEDVHMILGDRPVTLTLTRAWESLRLWGKTKLIFGLLLASLRKPKPDELKEWMEKILNGDTDLMSDSVAELAEHFPTLEEVIIKERDAYMACKLHQTCRALLTNESPHTNNRRYRLVAIVGAGHVEGICRWLTTDTSLTIKSADISEQTPENPEAVLSKLIKIKAPIEEEDHDYLVYQIPEVDPELVNEFA